MTKASTALDIVVYLTISIYFMTEVMQNYLWLEESELGTIYKMAIPRHVVYPSLTICPSYSLEDINARHIVNETWKVPNPTLDALTKVQHSYYKNDK